MSGPITSTDEIERWAPTITVQTRKAWSDEWTDWDPLTLYPDRYRFASNPEGASAVLIHDVGAGWMDDETLNQQFPEIDLLGHYCRITVQHEGNPAPDPVYWYGIVSEDGGDRGGAKNYPDVSPDPVLLRIQRFVCVGMESLFDKVYVDHSWIPGPKRINRPITFNLPHNFISGPGTGTGNRTSNISAVGAYVFEPDLATAQDWSTNKIVRYLAALFPITDWDNNINIPVEIFDPDDIIPDWDRPVFQVSHNTTLRTLLNKLLDRRRLLGWTVTVDESRSPAVVRIEPISFVTTDISLPSGANQPANQQKVSIDFDQAIDVSASLTKSIRHVSDQVIVRGARKRSCFTLSNDDGTLVPDWEPDDQNTYDNPPAVGETQAEQLRSMVEFRRKEDLKQVYSYFRVPTDWDYLVGGGGGESSSSLSSSSGSDNTEALPIDPDLGDDNFIFRGEFRFMRRLFREIYKRSLDESAQEDPPPLASIEIEDGKRRLIHELAETAITIDQGEGTGRTWSARLKIREECAGIVVKVSGAQQLVIADDDFGGDDETDDTPVRLSWRDMRVTVAAELDSYCTAVFPKNEDVPPENRGDDREIVIIDVGDAGHLDYVVPGTLIDVELGADINHAGGYVRDDREWMEDLAKFVYDWYGLPRQAFKFKMRQILDLLKIGQMVEKIGTGALEETVNSVVVGVTYDVKSQETQVDTQFAQLDDAVLADWFGGNG